MSTHWQEFKPPSRWPNNRKDRLHFTDRKDHTEAIPPTPPPSRFYRGSGCAFGAVLLIGAPMFAFGIFIAKWLGA